MPKRAHLDSSAVICASYHRRRKRPRTLEKEPSKEKTSTAVFKSVSAESGLTLAATPVSGAKDQFDLRLRWVTTDVRILLQAVPVSLDFLHKDQPAVISLFRVKHATDSEPFLKRVAVDQPTTCTFSIPGYNPAYTTSLVIEP